MPGRLPTTLNFWVCNFGGGLLGYAQFPGGPAATDGVVCGYPYVGNNGPGAGIYNLGRTGTHEVGHWLDLRHIWGDGGCGVDDRVSPTPRNRTLPTSIAPLGHESCGIGGHGPELHGLFSRRLHEPLYCRPGRAHASLVPARAVTRASLLTSNGCAPPCEVACGCTDAARPATSDPAAANDDGTCDFSCYGCTDATACNYDASCHHRRRQSCVVPATPHRWLRLHALTAARRPP